MWSLQLQRIVNMKLNLRPIMMSTARGCRPMKTIMLRHLRCSGRDATRPWKIRLKQDQISIKIKNNPISLLIAIKEHSLNYQKNRNSMLIILDVMRTVLTMKQREWESLQDYTKRFFVTRDMLNSHIGWPTILTKFVKAMNGCNKTDYKLRDKLREQAFSQFLA